MTQVFPLQAFYSELAVQNFPLRERTAEECEDLRRVQSIRKVEKAASTVSKVSALYSDYPQNPCDELEPTKPNIWCFKYVAEM